MEHFGIWLITSFMVTWGMYFTVYRSIKRFQNDVQYKELKFFICVVFMWIVVGVVVVTDNPVTQNILMLIGLIISLLIYSFFFVFKGEGRDKEK